MSKHFVLDCIVFQESPRLFFLNFRILENWRKTQFLILVVLKKVAFKLAKTRAFFSKKYCVERFSFFRENGFL